MKPTKNEDIDRQDGRALAQLLKTLDAHASKRGGIERGARATAKPTARIKTIGATRIANADEIIRVVRLTEIVVAIALTCELFHGTPERMRLF
ncbi:hypothetical protein EGJ34_12555 [Stenotrophomonas sp. 278]|nr:hypothetical protein EGJ34_12555 [Stenotrophomonas sp. 278]